MAPAKVVAQTPVAVQSARAVTKAPPLVRGMKKGVLMRRARGKSAPATVETHGPRHG